MLTSELIKKLQKQLRLHGDLPVYHTLQSRADVEIDDIQYLTNKIALANTHLDNYTLRISDKIKNIEDKIRHYQHEHNLYCNDCEWYTDDYETEYGCKYSYCLRGMKILSFSQRNWYGEENDKLLKCFSPKDEKLDNLLYYRSILLKEYKKEKKLYLETGVKWKEKMIDKLKINRRNNKMYPYSIMYMGREEVLLTDNELLDLYEQITDIIVDNEELII